MATTPRQPGWLQHDLRARGGEDFSAESGKRDGDVVGREREVQQDPQAAGAEVDALRGEPFGDGFRDKFRQPDRAVMIGKPGQAKLDRKEKQQGGVRQSAQEATQRC